MPRVGFLEKDHISGIKKIILPNGITVFLEELPERKKVIFLVGIGVGSRDEAAEINGISNILMRHGISHLAEHFHFVSTASHTADEITEDIEDGGAQMSGGTCFDSTIFCIKGYSRYLPRNIRILYEIISNFEYKEEELERERQEVLTEIKDAIDSPKDHYFSNLFLPILFRKTSFEKPILGTPKSVKCITKDDLVAFKKKFYVPNNMIILVCGKFDGERILKVIDRTFGKLKQQTFEASEYKIDLRNRRREPPPKKRKGLKLAYMALGYREPGFYHPDSIKLMLLDFILSGGMSSRLSRRLQREKGIGYDEVESDYQDFGGIGAFCVRIGGFDPRQFKEAKKIILEEMEDLKTNLVGKREFLRAKNLLLSNTDDNMENLKQYVEMLSDAYFGKNIFDPRNYKKHISKISREALRRTVQKYFSDKYTLTALVPENFKI
jgi:predicted Zn-dependent peptidase